MKGTCIGGTPQAPEEGGDGTKCPETSYGLFRYHDSSLFRYVDISIFRYHVISL